MRIGKWLSHLIEYTVGPGSKEELVRSCEVGNLQNKGTNTPKTRVEMGLMILTSSRTRKGENFKLDLPMDSLAGWGLRAAKNHWKSDLIVLNTDENRQILAWDSTRGSLYRIQMSLVTVINKKTGQYQSMIIQDIQVQVECDTVTVASSKWGWGKNWREPPNVGNFKLHIDPGLCRSGTKHVWLTWYKSTVILLEHTGIYWWK